MTDLLSNLTKMVKKGEMDPRDILDRFNARLAQRSLSAFLRQSWRYIDPGTYIHGWHIDAISEHLEAVNKGEIKRLLINIPPRHMKSISVSVAWPAWTWAQQMDPEHTLMGPAVRFLFASYAQTLAERDSLKTRRLIESPWYQKNWGDKVQITGDLNTKRRYETTAGGYRLATSVGGSLTGEGGDVIVVDDPLNAQDGNSAALRESCLTWWDEAMQSRLNNPKTGAMVVIMQRLHEEDLAGHVLDQGGWEHLCLPAEYDSYRHCVTSLGWEDPRGLDDDGARLEGDAREGEPLWPERIDHAELSRLRAALGPYAFAGQYQQMPEPRGGGIIKREWWRPWPPADMPESRSGRPVTFPPFEYVVASLDTAYTAKEENDYSALTIWGVWRDTGSRNLPPRMVNDSSGMLSLPDSSQPKVMLIYGWQKRLELHGPPEERPPGISDEEWSGPEWMAFRRKSWGLVEWVIHSCRLYQVDTLLVEAKASGLSVAQELRRLYANEDWGMQMVNPTGDKVARLYSVQHLFSNGQVYAPLDKAWCDTVVSQVTTFPKGAHDDIVDTVSQSLQHMRTIGMAIRSDEFERNLEDSMTLRKQGGRLYDT